jgi:pectate lyase
MKILEKMLRMSATIVAFILFPLLANAEGDGYGENNGGNSGTSVTVTTANDLANYASSDDAYNITVSGTIDFGEDGSFGVGSNTTIQGEDASSTILGTIYIDGVSNVIIKQLNISAPTGDAGDNDGVSIRGGASGILVTKCNIYNCTDGCLDVTHGGGTATISWNKFYYTWDNGHNFTCLVGASDDDYGTYQLTYHHNWWAEGCQQRMTATRFGPVHMYNNYWNCSGNYYCTTSRTICEMLSENNYYDEVSNPLAIEQEGTLRTSGNIFNNCSGSQVTSSDDVFSPPYSYSLTNTEDVPDEVTAGAGNVWSSGDGSISAYSTIEAEDYGSQSGIQTEACDEGGEDVGYINDGDWIGFNNVDFGSGADGFTARVASNASGGTIEIRLDDAGGIQVGSCSVSNTGGWQTYTDVSCSVSGASGEHDLYLTFSGGDGYLFNINHFSFNEGSSGGGTITEGCYSIISKHSGKALDVSGWSTEDGGNIQQWAYSEDQANQKWNIVSAGDGYYKIESVHSGRALDVESASTEDGANIQQWGYGSGGDHKEFSFEEMDDGYYRIRTRHCDKCIDVYGASTDDGANVIQWSCHDNDNQRWELTYLSGLKSAKVSTGIDSKDMSNTLYIYPNPSSKGMIKIHLPSNIEGKVKISISNIQGKLYYSEVVSAKSVININHELPNGLYLINIKGNSLTATKKIIVK